jgi:dihydroorotate dehydrogenase
MAIKRYDTIPTSHRPTITNPKRQYLITMVDLSVTLAGVPLTSCIYNASGPRTGSSAAMSKIAQSASGGVLAKSATVASQKGNDLPRYVQVCNMFQFSVGMK